MEKDKSSHWETEADPVWINVEGLLKPSPYFLKWWQDVSVLKFGDTDHWLDVAIELRYVRVDRDPVSKEVVYEPDGFDYDHKLVRNTLGIAENMPIIRYKESGQEAYQKMWDMLLDKDGGKDAR